MAKVLAVCTSEVRGTKKKVVPYIDVLVDYGIVGDAHAGNWHRQISMLAQESVNKMRAKGLVLSAGDFAENILTSGIVLNTLKIGTKLSVGDTVLEVTQIGKECHSDCEIKRLSGMCVMPTDGIFVKVIKEGRICAGDNILICEDNYEADKNC